MLWNSPKTKGLVWDHTIWVQKEREDGSFRTLVLTLSISFRQRDLSTIIYFGKNFSDFGEVLTDFNLCQLTGVTSSKVGLPIPRTPTETYCNF